MNFLAHLWLADRSRTSLAGSILGDVVRGSDLSMYPDEIALGIRLHRRVDAATDRHPLIAVAKQRFAPQSRRYAGIVLDVVCDHLLARDWAGFSDEALPQFCQRAGAAIADAQPWFLRAGGIGSDSARFALLLMSYQSEAGIDRALMRISQRLRDPQALLQAAQGWVAHAQPLRAELPTILDALLRVMETPVSEKT